MHRVNQPGHDVPRLEETLISRGSSTPGPSDRYRAEIRIGSRWDRVYYSTNASNTMHTCTSIEGVDIMHTTTHLRSAEPIQLSPIGAAHITRGQSHHVFVNRTPELPNGAAPLIRMAAKMTAWRSTTYTPCPHETRSRHMRPEY